MTLNEPLGTTLSLDTVINPDQAYDLKFVTLPSRRHDAPAHAYDGIVYGLMTWNDLMAKGLLDGSPLFKRKVSIGTDGLMLPLPRKAFSFHHNTSRLFPFAFS